MFCYVIDLTTRLGVIDTYINHTKFIKKQSTCTIFSFIKFFTYILVVPSFSKKTIGKKIKCTI